MPIGGFVISAIPDKREKIIEKLKEIPEIEVYGSDERGNIIAVIESETSEEMEKLIDEIKGWQDILSIGLSYLHFEDEVDKIEKGEIKPRNIFRKRRI